MIGGIIQENHAVLLPTWSLPIQVLHQVPHEEHEGVLVSVSVAQGEVDSAVRVQRGDHGEGRRNGFRGRRSRGKRPAPGFALEVGFCEPCLIHVNYPLPLVQQSQQRKGKLLSKHEAPWFVGLGRHLLRLLVDQVHLLFQNVANQLRAYRHLVVSQNLLLNLLTTRHWLPIIQQLICGLLDEFDPQ